MDAERALVSKVAHLGRGAADLMIDGVTGELIVNDDCREVWEFIVAHQAKYGKQPTVPTIIERFEHFNFELTEETLEYVRDRFIEAVERREAIDFARALAVACNDPSFAGQLGDLILEKGRDLKNLLPGSKVTYFTDAQHRIDKFLERAETGETYTGLKIGIPDIDDATLGIQSHELVSVVGWQGTGKSTLVQWILGNFFLQGKRSMFISLEMTAEALMRKWDQMFQQFTSYKHLKMLNLTDQEIERWRQWAKDAKNKVGPEIMVLDQGGAWTVERVHGEILKHKPDVVAIDYLSLMELPGSNLQRWEKLTKLTRDLKQIAQSSLVPIIAISQTNRDSAKAGAQMENIGGSYSVGADSDIVLGLHQDDEMRAGKEMEVRLIKNRDGEMVETSIYWDMHNMKFADSFMLEQVRKTRAKTELQALVEKGLNPKVDPETGEIIGVEEPETSEYRIGEAAAHIGEENEDAASG